MEEPFQLVWGLVSADDLTGTGCTLDTMNDIELIYHTDTKDYSVSVEAHYSFGSYEEQFEYLRTMLDAFTDWMVEQGYPTDHRFHPYWHFSEGANINTHFETIPEAYANFELLVNGFCAGKNKKTKGVIDVDRPYNVGPGWWPIIDKHMEQAKKIDPECTIFVKEKYGTLRADIDSEKDDEKSANEFFRIEREMEDATESVCEICGGPGGLKNMQNWYLTLCDSCASLDALERRKVFTEAEERYYRQKTAQSLFGILPPDSEQK